MSFWESLNSQIEETYTNYDEVEEEFEFEPSQSTTTTTTTTTTSTTNNNKNNNTSNKSNKDKRKSKQTPVNGDEVDEDNDDDDYGNELDTSVEGGEIVSRLKRRRVSKNRVVKPVDHGTATDDRTTRKSVAQESDAIHNQLFQLPLRWPYYNQDQSEFYSSEKVLPHNFTEEYLDHLQENIQSLWSIFNPKNDDNQSIELTPNMITVLSMMSSTFLTDLLDNLFYNDEVKSASFSNFKYNLRNLEIEIPDVIQSANALYQVPNIKEIMENAQPQLKELLNIRNRYSNSKKTDKQTEQSHMQSLLKEGWNVKISDKGGWLKNH
ncbi:hypothetical protein PPL_01486 [Heterostelium album PN500]|uniref:Uncharacterized protein n=1 Tax=Heterostelium pallidum (strain ATCC 26659 / Pp 5 / PN500) TaxID=670386 RepID=D3AZE5_HETP5|nr:hypothetical protein PPL_01486 [Heterostelium album PN500]EFA85528.1 hypothetical protein PPL_01486 [Heterostelium album PN500]|eukprot:XP_020437636.1 hypothetical protein PPL_01486 [Heterostelium album PN500]